MQARLTRFREQRPTKITAMILACLFPLCLVLMAEVNQSGDWGIIGKLFLETPGILLFDVLVVVFLYGILSLLFRRFAPAAAVTSLFWYTVSCIEFYRYQSSGSHFTLYDLSVVTNLGDVMEFAEIHLYAFQFITLLVLALYCAGLFFLNPKIPVTKRHIIPGCSSCLMIAVLFVLFPGFSSTVYDVFGIEHGGINNNFVQEEKFEQNSMIAFLVENLSDVIQTTNIQAPDNYSEESIETLSVNPVDTKPQTSVKPNVITIMSESYADFRVFEDLQIEDSYYKNFDQFRKEGFSGNAIVPTFGGYTVRTEFELQFGLPIKSLNGTVSPQKLMTEEEQTTVASYYRSEGYSTTYIHPYTSKLYRRAELYPYFGYDRLYFEDSFIDPGRFHGYIDDQSAYEKAVEQILIDEKPSYIHLTTMQNHMPYHTGSKSEFDYYMDGVAQTDEALGKLMEELKRIDEPTIVLYVGDHYPSFTENYSVYDRLSIDASNCRTMYQQHYFVWSNYDFQFDTNGEEYVSSFYLPWLLIDKIGLSKNEIIDIMLEQFQKDPVYTMEFQSEYSNEVLDTLTYDLIVGDKFSNYYLR